MKYDVYLKYNAAIPIGINKHWGDLCDHVWTDIMCMTDEDEVDEDDDEYEDTKIGLLDWILYNQTLAMAHGVDMTQVPYLSMQANSQALLELDYTRISQETIDEIGATSNPNILILMHFGISAAWRNKQIGEKVLKGLMEQMKGKCGYIVIIHNKPAQCGEHNGPGSLYIRQGVELDGLEPDPEKAQLKLNAFWQRCGFRQFKNYDNVFVCNVEQVVPERSPVERSVSQLP